MYKKVAMVEQFFDIIYSVHVEAAGDTQIRGRAGKHCGQKRTYRAVSIITSLKKIYVGIFSVLLKIYRLQGPCLFACDKFKFVIFLIL